MEVIEFDEEGNHMNSNFMDYLTPTSMELPNHELGEFGHPFDAPPPRREGRRRVSTVGSPAAVVNAVVDALSPYGVRHVDMPLTPSKIWSLLRENGEGS